MSIKFDINNPPTASDFVHDDINSIIANFIWSLSILIPLYLISKYPIATGLMVMVIMGIAFKILKNCTTSYSEVSSYEYKFLTEALGADEIVKAYIGKVYAQGRRITSWELNKLESYLQNLRRDQIMQNTSGM